MAKALTAQQQRAIDHRGQDLQIVACAGSGKTEVMARRVAALLASREALPRNIVAFTFTERAAAELKDRIEHRIKDACADTIGLAEMFVGTIHGFCLELLKSELPKYLKYEVLNEVQQSLLIDRHSKGSGLTETKTLKGESLKRWKDTARYVDALNILRESDVNATKLSGTSIFHGLRRYEELLDARHYLDYSGMLKTAVQALEHNDDLKIRLRERIKYVIVDEYQDVNPIQERLIRSLHDLGAFVCVVGDDDQTIYQWRGGEVRNILSFSERYAPVEEIKLEENFRSSDAIVTLAGNFIASNHDRLTKRMVPTGAQAFEVGDICALTFDKPETEAEWIVDTIKSLRGVAFNDDARVRGLAYSDMAILLRSVKANGDPVVQALRDADVPFIIRGMNQLFDAAEAVAARELFYFLASETGNDAAVLRASWLSADLGLSDADLDRAIESAIQYRSALHAAEEHRERWALYNLQRQFLSFLEELRLVEEGLSEERRAVVFYNLGKFSQLISDFEAIHFHSKPLEKYRSFADWLRYRAEGAYSEGGQDNPYLQPDAVQVMTIHQAKGMQWPVVFMPALLRNRFPSPGIGGPTAWHIIPEGVVRDAARYRGGIEDERRLFYVAITRSQKFLFMTWAPIAGKKNRYILPSVFWDAVLASKSVKRKRPDFSVRARTAVVPGESVSNVVFSFSDLKYLFECPYQFKLRILYGFNPPIAEALGYGKSLHDALAEVHMRALQGHTPQASDAESLVERHLHVPYAYPDLRKKLMESAKNIVADYIRDNSSRFAHVEFAEKTIEIGLGDGVSVIGRIDLVRKLDTDEVTIVDLKSSGRTQAESVTELQLHVYALGYEALTGHDADFVEIYELDERRQRPRAIDEDFIEDVKRHVRGAADDIRKNEFDRRGDPTTCRRCDYRRLCSKGLRLTEEA